jgi:hypothetical protein
MFHDKYLSSRALEFLKEKEDVLPGAGPILTIGLLFEQTW